MRLRFFVFFLFLPLEIIAVEPFTLDKIEQTIGKDWFGAIFYCHPYCELLALKETDVWSPAPLNQPVEWESLRFVKSSDPEYPLLIKSYKDRLKKDASKKKAEKDISDLTPEERRLEKLGRSWLSLFGLGLGYDLLEVKSNTEIQQDLKPAGEVFLIDLHFALRRIRSSSIFKRNFKHFISVHYLRSLSYESENSEKKVQWSSWQLDYGFPTALNGFRLGPTLQLSESSYSVSPEDLSGFPTKTRTFNVGLVGQYQRLISTFYTNIYSQLTDNGAFRSGSIDHRLYRFHLEYSTLHKELWGFRFIVFGSYEYRIDKQTSDLSNQLFGISKSQIEFDSHTVTVGLRSGDNLWFD